ncbi:EAL domain-containing protein [Parasulfuritortus cantonensis]|uniref:EAL domain-containing protein n=1 Tax=Parasulfuritortus cantonensis TaxID=2528202 RepID=A0A4R1BKY9_9PROT|nr:EAL domain-containing protein [Parasulfuritortus cantonensis]TCJ18033.1 EAL domain-containing protein [Parasulfuritortus cantonensis]
MPPSTETAAPAVPPPAQTGLGGVAMGRPHDGRLLRRMTRIVVAAWTVAIAASLYLNLNPIYEHASAGGIAGTAAASHFTIWLFGIAGIALAVRHLHRQLARREVELSELELSAKVFDDSLQGIAITDVQGRILRVNPMFTGITGFAADEVIGRPIAILASESEPSEGGNGMWRQLRAEGGWVGEAWLQRKNGDVFAVWQSASAIDGAAGEHLSYIFMFQDITDRKLFSSRLEQLAHYDPLTHLPNRRLLADRVGHAIQRAGRNQGRHALLFIDLDRFKRINDTVGHAAGDQLLTVIAGRLTECVRASDTVARLGGDEFAVLLEDIHGPGDAERVAEKVLAALAAPVLLEDREWYVGASIGIGLSPKDGEDMASLLKNADTAMYRAKADGRHCFRFFNEDMAASAALQVARETALRLAIQNQAFSLEYQPQVELASGRVVGVEALIRWRQDGHPVAPLEFIPLAEETGLIVAIGRWVLATACQDIADLRRAGHGDLKLAVNISAIELKQLDFVEQVVLALAETGLPAASLELEITESTMMEDITRVASVLDSLSAMGVGAAIDDFGTGYSSLAYLKQLPVDHLKIDRSFVRDVPRDMEDSTIVRAVLTMSRTFGLKVVAEGIETEEQMAFLRESGCQIGQGYLISHPLPLAALTAWLAARPG